MFPLHPRVKVSIVGNLRDREVACSASDRQGSNFESCVWRTVSSQSSHHPQEVPLEVHFCSTSMKWWVVSFTQLTRDVGSVLFQSWSTVCDASPHRNNTGPTSCVSWVIFTANTKHLYSIYTMFDQRWAVAVQMLYKSFVFDVIVKKNGPSMIF